MINNKPNLFQWATKELSQDAVLLYLADCYNYEETKIVGEKFLHTFYGEFVKPDKVYSIKQYYNIDVLIVLEYVTHYDLLVVEDKTNTSFHSNQLSRYRELIQNLKNFEYTDYGITYKPIKNTKFVYFKPILFDDNEKQVCENEAYSIRVYEDLLTVLESNNSDPVLQTYLEYYRHAHLKESLWMQLDKLPSLNNESTDELMSSYCGQWILMKLLLRQIEDDRFNIGRMYQGTSFGRPYTQYRFIIDNDCQEKNWLNLKFDTEVRGDYSYFFRLDSDTDGYYISCNQYIYDKNKATQREKLEEHTSLTEYLRGKSINHLHKGRGKKETRLWLYYFKTIDDLLHVTDELSNLRNCITEFISEKYKQ